MEKIKPPGNETIVSCKAIISIVSAADHSEAGQNRAK